jgi:subtilisin family serine protease
MPSATPQELASAIVETIDAGVRILNLSAALAQPSFKGEGELQSALDYAAQRAVIVVAAAGNQGIGWQLRYHASPLGDSGCWL